MDYNSYECTPLFSYDLSRTAIRQIKADNRRLQRQYSHTSSADHRGRKGSKPSVAGRLLLAVISIF